VKTTNLLKYLSVAGSIFGVLSTQTAIPGVTPARSVAIIGTCAILFKVCDIIENFLKQQSHST
jgi:hypothetical protein